MVDPAIPAKLLLGETWGFWVQTGALVLSAIGALWIIRSRERSERRRATIDLVIHQKADHELQDAKTWMLSKHEEHANNLTQYLADKTKDESKYILRILNNYEFIAAGIREKALDEEIFKRVQFSVLMKDWEALSGCAMEIRRNTNRPTLFQEFQRLAKRWTKKPLKTES